MKANIFRSPVLLAKFTSDASLGQLSGGWSAHPRQIEFVIVGSIKFPAQLKLSGLHAPIYTNLYTEIKSLGACPRRDLLSIPGRLSYLRAWKGMQWNSKNFEEVGT